MTMRSASRFCSTRACRLDAGLLSVMQPLLETSPSRSRVRTLINLILPLERTHITLGYGMAVLARDAVQQREGWKGARGRLGADALRQAMLQMQTQPGNGFAAIVGDPEFNQQTLLMTNLLSR